MSSTESVTDVELASLKKQGTLGYPSTSEDQSSPASSTYFITIALSYLSFTLTDSALRMIILLELFKRGFQVCLFLAYYATYP